jgi:hypothetical protein
MSVVAPHTNPDGDLRWLNRANQEYTAARFAIMMKRVFPRVQKQHLERMRKEFVERHDLRAHGRNTTARINFRSFIDENINQLGVVNTDDQLFFGRNSSMPMGVYYETSNRRLQTMAWYAREQQNELLGTQHHQQALPRVDPGSD